MNINYMLNEEILNLFETYKTVNEIIKLGSDIIKLLSKECVNILNKYGKLNDLPVINLSSIDSSNYLELKDFIHNFNLKIRFIPVTSLSNVRGKYITNLNNNNNSYIEIFVEYNTINLIINQYIESRKDNTSLDYNSIYITISDKLFNALIHELQHAFDDYRSNNKIFQSTKSKKYFNYQNKLNSINTVLNNKNDNDKDDDNLKSSLIYNKLKLQQINRYINLPMEIWARFIQTVDILFFKELKFDANNNIYYIMRPIYDVVLDFKKNYPLFNNLSEKMQRKLINKIVQFWHFEKENLEKENLENKMKMFNNNPNKK